MTWDLSRFSSQEASALSPVQNLTKKNIQSNEVDVFPRRAWFLKGSYEFAAPSYPGIPKMFGVYGKPNEVFNNACWGMDL